MMIKAIRKKTDNLYTDREVYQQALDDFGIIELQQKLSLFTSIKLEEEELDSLVVLLLQQLTTNLNQHLIADYLNAIRRRDKDVICGLNPITIKEISQPISLPDNFLNSAPPPRFLYGNKVRWIPASGNSDWGIILGRFYAYARHRCQWGWKYIVLLDKNSPSSGCVVADTAWEEDIELLAFEEAS